MVPGAELKWAPSALISLQVGVGETGKYQQGYQQKSAVEWFVSRRRSPQCERDAGSSPPADAVGDAVICRARCWCNPLDTMRLGGIVFRGDARLRHAAPLLSLGMANAVRRAEAAL